MCGKSISNDVDNVATLLRVSGLLPRTFDFAPLLEEAKRQLHDEADYLKRKRPTWKTIAAAWPTTAIPLPGRCIAR